jgi:hypothetical protein
MDFRLDFLKLFFKNYSIGVAFLSFKFVMSIFWQFSFLQLSLSLQSFPNKRSPSCAKSTPKI